MESVVPAMIEPRTSIPALHFCACTEKEKYSPAVTCHELLMVPVSFAVRCYLASL
jgi:hypothetical protein